MVSEDTWRQHMNELGQIEDDFQLRKVMQYVFDIFFNVFNVSDIFFNVFCLLVKFGCFV